MKSFIFMCLLTTLLFSLVNSYSYGLASKYASLSAKNQVNKLTKANNFKRKVSIEEMHSFKLFAEDEKRKITRDNEGDYFVSEVLIEIF
jgi:hypothetical protein